MKISYNWLKQFIATDWTAEKTGELLTDLGLEVEGITTFSSVKGGLKGIVVGEVLTCEKHPNADRLKITRVDLGAGKIVQIVCGAANVAKGQKVPVATVGAELFAEDGKPWTIHAGKIRGEVSEGMICAEDELGLGKSHDGIMVLDENLEPGVLLSEIFEVEEDYVFEIGLTPNRADAMSHWGVARDLRASLLQHNVSTKINTPSSSNFQVYNRSLKIDVDVEDSHLAPRYCGITISNLKVAESPEWLKNRLKSIGITPKNNVVDVTNYVLHDLGQPLHAFDADKIKDGKIVVKTLEKGTKFSTLDGVERILSDEDLMICDSEKPLCIAGVFGGIESGVSAETTTIFLESAYFNPVSIRKSAKRHGLSTDASFRFERGIDPNITDYALRYAAVMLMEIADGQVTSDLIDIYPKKIEGHQVFLNFNKAEKFIGEEIPKEIIKEILTSLEIKINNITETGLGMTIPAYRNDVTREADVIEEILRVYGYNNIKFTQKLNATISTTDEVEDYQIQNKISSQLTALGFNEMMANSLTSPKFVNYVDTLLENENVLMLNPLSQDLSAMRQSMLFGALEALSYNANRKNGSLRLFEFGKTYHKKSKEHTEPKHLSLLVTGEKRIQNWTDKAEKSDFFYFKGIIIAVLERLGIGNYHEEFCQTNMFSESLRLIKNNKVLVEFGLVSNKILSHFDVDSETLFADFNWNEILKNISGKWHKYESISKFPAVKRDFALLIDKNIVYGDLKAAALKTERKLLKEVKLFDVYTGNNLPEGKKSYALSFTLLDENKTLTDTQIDKIMSKLQSVFEKDFGAILR